MMTMLKNLWKDEEGVTIAEYALMLVLVALAVAVLAPSVTTGVGRVFTATDAALTPP